MKPTQSLKYVKSIRNNFKRSYATRYRDWLLAGERGAAPEPTGLTPMAAQAVRLRLHEAIEFALIPTDSTP